VMANAATSKSDGFILADGITDRTQLPEGTASEGPGRSDNI
jgi:hypothetical protein